MTTSDVTKYYYTGSAVLYTLDEDNKKTSENIISTSSEIIAGKRFIGGEYENNCYFYNYDMRGSTTAVLDPDGAYTAGYQYDAFGNTASRGDNGFLNETEFIGCIADKSSGLYYMNARYYNPKTGRFLTQDAMGGDAWTNNLYSYCGNNPVGFKDPTGYRLVIAEDDYGRPITTAPVTPKLDDDKDEKHNSDRDITEEDLVDYFKGYMDANLIDTVLKAFELEGFSVGFNALLAIKTMIMAKGS